MHREELLRRLDRAGLVAYDRGLAVVQDRANAGRPAEEVLVAAGLVSEMALARLVAESYRVPFVSLADHPVSPDVVRTVPRDVAENYAILPIERDGDVLTLAMADPLDLMAEDLVRFMTSCQIRRVMAARSELMAALASAYEGRPWPGALGEAAAPPAPESHEAAPAVLPGVEAAPPAAPTAGQAAALLLEAARERASDVHFEPGAEGLTVRFRVDGLMQKALEVGPDQRQAVLDEVRRMVGLGPGGWGRTGGGRGVLRAEGLEVDLMATALPTLHGQKIVVRLREKGRNVPDLDRMGFLPDAYRRLAGLLERPSGLLLVSGPAGSGRTTTLYAMLHHLEPLARSLVALEDTWMPDLSSVTCVPFGDEAGLDVAEAFQAALLQRPDVVLLRRLPDQRTADLVVRAAGEALVLASLDADSAVEAARRLLRLATTPAQAAGVLLGVVAQRRVRRLCEHCLEKARTAPRAVLPEGVRVPERHFTGRGCPECGYSGFRLTTGVHEILRMTERVRELLWAGAPPPRIVEAARADGMVPLLEDGLAKVGMGLTSLEELLRVVPAEALGQRICPECRRAMEEDFRACPYCAGGLEQMCPSCRRPVEPAWNTCPYCLLTLHRPPMVAETREDLAAVPAASSEEREAAPRAALPPGPLTVLVADHDAASRAGFLDALERAGYDVLLADDGVDAVDLMESERPDIILAEVRLPRVDGLEVARKAREGALGMPILLLHPERPDGPLLERILEAGADGCLSKAEGMAGWLPQIAEALESRATASMEAAEAPGRAEG